jgi:argininosuccinate lyase
MGKAWGGRFTGKTDDRVERFTESVSFDKRLLRVDVQGSSAHAKMLSEVGLITAVEAQSIAEELERIADDFESGRLAWDFALEDVHLHVESELIKRLGDVGRKLHTGRSRNDQVATDLRLWTRNALDELDVRLGEVQKSLTAAATRWADVILPAYTHLQRAQPVLAAHYCLAYVEKLQRDRDRAADARRRVNVLPLGSAAVAGSSLPLDRRRVAVLLGFDGVMANSIDAASDRDFVLETAFVTAAVAGRLSGWAEEWILWSTTEFGFLRLPDAFCTGSSIMPQKKNPDVLELIRGKTGRVIGALTGLFVLLKGLPLAYNRDLQEDKPLLFDSVDTTLSCLDMAALMISGAELNVKTIAARLDKGFLDATTLMERLIEAGVPMRSAHETVGLLVKKCEETDISLAELPDAEFEAAVPGKGRSLKAALGAENSVRAFHTEGSTAPEKVAEQVAHWRKRLGMD